MAEGPSEMRRIDQQRAVVIQANIEGFDLMGPAAQISSVLETQEALSRNDQVSWKIAGQSKRWKEVFFYANGVVFGCFFGVCDHGLFF